MAGSQDQVEEDDPRVSHMLRRLRRTMMVAMVVPLIGMAVVVLVILYRIMQRPATPAPEAAQQSAGPAPTLPAGSRIAGTTADGSRLYVTVTTPDGAQAILVYDAASRAYRGRIAVVPPQAAARP